MQKETKSRQVKFRCPNCWNMGMVWRDEHRVIRYECPQCRAATISKQIGRRHIRLDVYAPPDTEAL